MKSELSLKGECMIVILLILVLVILGLFEKPLAEKVADGIALAKYREEQVEWKVSHPRTPLSRDAVKCIWLMIGIGSLLFLPLLIAALGWK